jgi:PadR family transcriptional regulator, regulatory protein PadR
MAWSNSFLIEINFLKKSMHNIWMHKNIMYVCIKLYQFIMNQHLKGSLSTIILKLLHDNGRMYGYEITQKVKELTQDDIQITEGALYPILHKLEAEEVLTAELEKVDGRTRKYYKITPKGNAVAVDRIAELKAFAENLNLILNPKLSLS